MRYYKYAKLLLLKRAATFCSIVIHLSTISLAQAQSWEAMGPTLNFFGNAGLFDTPTGHAMRDADLSFTANVIGGSGHKTQRSAVNFQIGRACQEHSDIPHWTISATAIHTWIVDLTYATF